MNPRTLRLLTENLPNLEELNLRNRLLDEETNAAITIDGLQILTNAPFARRIRKLSLSKDTRN
jgi:hypothetical protein